MCAIAGFSDSFRIILTVLALIGLTLSPSPSTAQAAPGEWIWMGGVDSGIYGAEYQFAPDNTPGFRVSAASWTGADGRFWLFGGDGLDSRGFAGDLNDLWVFDPSLGAHGEWAWVGGSSTGATNLSTVSCPSACGVYGTEYQFADKNWPGAREFPDYWTDRNGRFWIYGGYGLDSIGTWSWMDDLWVFDPTRGNHGQWAWMGGPKTFPKLTKTAPVYGAKYEFAPANWPGTRSGWGVGGGATFWTQSDGSDRFWLLGGAGYYADLWVFDPSQGAHGEWAWMGGPDAGGPTPPVYGAEYKSAPDNDPGYRSYSATWTGKDGRLWLSGGLADPTGNSLQDTNDLWVFDPAQGAHGEWAWMGGANSGNARAFSQPSCGTHLVPANAGVYGTEYTFAPANVPGGRDTATAWTDNDGRLWLYGGWGVAECGMQGALDDLWVFDPSRGAHGEWAWMGGHMRLGPPWPPVLGKQYEAGPANSPGACGTGCLVSNWVDQEGNFWMFGSDFWKFTFISPQTITFPALSAVTYGVPPIILPATASSGLPITYKVISGPGSVSGSALTVTGAGKYIVIRATQPGNNQYYLAPTQTRDVFVYRARLTIQADNKTMTRGGAVPALTWTPSGFVKNDTAAVLTGAPRLTTTATSTSPPGTYPIRITVGTLGADNYRLFLHDGTLIIH